jgi:uncharacterized protein
VKVLLDVSALVALLWENHVHNVRVEKWAKGKTLVLCPITELGFVRVSSSPAHNATVKEAREVLADFIRDFSPEFIPADARQLDTKAAPTSGRTTDWYLAELAQRHGLKWGTLDESTAHPAALVID